tara:strand:+ start:480 stop:1169 length:690 start_codon:yes stop_codon:yes gene_type:complete
MAFSAEQIKDVPPILVESLNEIKENLNNALWLHKQSGKLIIKHYALERIATDKGIKFDPPVVIESDIANKSVALSVTAHLGDKSEWSIGEASSYNCQMNYPYAMAEKRAKDRVILKLLDVHGEVYSQEEADDFDDNRRELAELKNMIKRNCEQSKAVRDNMDAIATIITGISDSPDYSLGDAARAWMELEEETQKAIWIAQSKGGILTTQEQKMIKSDEWSNEVRANLK